MNWKKTSRTINEVQYSLMYVGYLRRDKATNSIKGQFNVKACDFDFFLIVELTLEVDHNIYCLVD